MKFNLKRLRLRAYLFLRRNRKHDYRLVSKHSILFDYCKNERWGYWRDRLGRLWMGAMDRRAAKHEMVRMAYRDRDRDLILAEEW